AGADRRLDDGVVGVLARRIRADVAQAAADLEVLAERMRDRDVAARGAGHPFLVARDELQDPHLQGGGAGEAPDAAQAEHQAAVAQLLRGGLAVGGDALHAEPGPAGADHAFEGEVALPEPVARAIADVREPDGARPVDVPRRAEEGLAAEDHPLVAHFAVLLALGLADREAHVDGVRAAGVVLQRRVADDVDARADVADGGAAAGPGVIGGIRHDGAWGEEREGGETEIVHGCFLLDCRGAYTSRRARGVIDSPQLEVAPYNLKTRSTLSW